MTLASQKDYGRQGALQGHTGEAAGPTALVCVCAGVGVCVCGRNMYEVDALKLNGACRVPNEPVLAGGLTHCDLPLCTSLSHLVCQRMAVNLRLP